MTRPITERGSPANLDAEEGLLASCILDPAVIVRAEEHGINEASFFKPAHQLIWSATKAVYVKGNPLDEISLCEELNRRPFGTSTQLDAVGGHAEVNRLTNRIETTAHSLYWVKVVKEKAALRKLVSMATGLVERAYASEDLEALLARGEASIAELMAETAKGETDAPPPNPGKARAEAKLLAKAEAFRFDLSKPPHEDPWILKLGGVEILHPGNFLAVIAPQKSGKSTTESAMIGSLFGMEGADYLGFTGRNPEGKGVLHVDTEQSARDHYSMMVRTLRRARYTDFPDWFTSLHVRRFSSEDRRKIVLGAARKMHGQRGLLAVFIDGVVDLLTDFNDIRETTALINDLMSLAEETGCAIICAIHVNPGAHKGKSSDKARGHLGTMLEQKAETIILLDKQTGQDGNDRITISTKDARHGGVKAPPVFTWSDEAKMHVTVSLGEGFTALPSLADRKADQLATLARDIFDGWAGGMMPFSMVRERAMQVGAMPTRTAERRINELMRAGLIIKSDSGHYGLNVQGPN